jgi:hypothetical protein
MRSPSPPLSIWSNIVTATEQDKLERVVKHVVGEEDGKKKRCVGESVGGLPLL